jgi:nucleotide-sensitive chloride channel 1A
MTFYAPNQSTGIIVTYPSITVTAQDGAEVLLELTLSPPDVADEDIEVLQLRILPSSIEFPENHDHATNGTTEQEPNGATSATTINGSSSSSTNPPSAALFHALSNCQELNPDPRLPGDEDEDDEDGEGMGGFDETAPGATGWITSENLADFMDAEGNFRMPGGVTMIGGGEGEFADADEKDAGDAGDAARVSDGAAAGSVRRREEAGEGGDGGESKWQRTS